MRSWEELLKNIISWDIKQDFYVYEYRICKTINTKRYKILILEVENYNDNLSYTKRQEMVENI